FSKNKCRTDFKEIQIITGRHISKQHKSKRTRRSCPWLLPDNNHQANEWPARMQSRTWSAPTGMYSGFGQLNVGRPFKSDRFEQVGILVNNTRANVPVGAAHGCDQIITTKPMNGLQECNRGHGPLLQECIAGLDN